MTQRKAFLNNDKSKNEEVKRKYEEKYWIVKLFNGFKAENGMSSK